MDGSAWLLELVNITLAESLKVKLARLKLDGEHADKLCSKSQMVKLHGTNGEMRRFRDTRKGGGVLIDCATTMPLRITEPFVNRMSRRHAPGPNFEIVPRDRAVRRLPPRVRNGSIEAQQLGPRLQKLYSPCVDQQPEDFRMLILALDRKVQKQ